MQEVDILIKKLVDTIPEVDELVLQPYTYITKIPGKKIRDKLVLALDHWMKVPKDKLAIITDVISLLHHSSLIHDDIEDDSQLRRGVPTAHKIYGVPITFNAGSLVYFKALQRTLELNHPKAATIFAEQLAQLHRGQGMELHWRDNCVCPSEEDYKLMVLRKTGGLFMLAARLMQLFSDFPHNVERVFTLFGVYFQVRDDYCNLAHKDYADQKTYAEDLTEGKFSYPVMHAIRTDTKDQKVLQILRQRTDNFDLKRYCVTLMEEMGSFKYVYGELEKLETETYAEIKKLGGNPVLDQVMKVLSDWKNFKQL